MPLAARLPVGARPRRPRDPSGMAVFVLVEGLTTAGTLYAFGHLLRRSGHVVRIKADGVEVEDGLGRYRVPWEAIDRAWEWFRGHWRGFD